MTYINEGVVDRVVRIVGGLALAYAAIVTWPGTLSAVLMLLGVIAFVTGVSGWCLLYALMDVSTNKKTIA